MTHDFIDGILWMLAVGGGLWLLFMLTVGAAFLVAGVVDFFKRVRLVRRINRRIERC